MPMPRVRSKNLMSRDRYFLCEEERKYRMNLKDQLKKVMDDQEKLERKKDKFLEEYDEKKKKILLKKKDLKQNHESKKYHLYDPIYRKGMETLGTKNPGK